VDCAINTLNQVFASSELEYIPRDKLCISDPKIEKVLGRGSFGKVYLVRKIDTGKVYTLKELEKEVIEGRN